MLRKEDRDVEGGDVGLKSVRNGIHLREWNQFSVIASIAIPWLLLAIVLSRNAYYTLYGTDRFHQHKLYPSQLTYSPAQDEIEYEVKMYHTGIEYAPAEFQGPPSESLDRAWDGIFNCEYKYFKTLNHPLISLSWNINHFGRTGETNDKLYIPRPES